jgi:hypothetical protein
MTSDSKKTDHQKLRWLLIGFVVYFLIMLIAFHYAYSVPYQIFALGGILNMAILFIFIYAIRRVYLRSRRHVDLESSGTSEITSNSRLELDRRRLPWLWGGAGISFLTCVNGLYNASNLPYAAVIGIVTLNVAIVTVFILEIRRVSKRLRQ